MDSINDLSIQDLLNAKRILAIQPHYDDNDIAVGGTLLSLARKDIEIIYLTVTNDLAGVLTPGISTDEARQHLRADQVNAGKLLGVNNQIHLGLSDGGDYSYFKLRSTLIDQIRGCQPDFIFTVDPWTPYEAHNDHIMTGKATAEAIIFLGLPAFGNHSQSIDPAYQLAGIVFYNSAFPNNIFDITSVITEKRLLLESYKTQFTQEGLTTLINQTTALAAYIARDEPFEFGEAFKLIPPWMLHGFPLTMYV